ncbi:MAG: winged helix-turn-helix domain-containing protein [Nitrososphaera sp.]|nr:winged helix-turn-helix domain-containing protein [Nitrososphaera sp.]
MRVTTLGPKAARALNDKIRIRILELISHKPMSAEELTRALGSSGYKKAMTTVRHHIDTLRSSGLIEATRMVEVRGAVMKYYSPKLRAFTYESPDGLDTKYSKLIDDISGRLLKVMRTIHEDKKFAAEHEAKNFNTCTQCKTNHFKEFVALELLNSAVARAMGKKEYGEILASIRTSAKVPGTGKD